MVVLASHPIVIESEKHAVQEVIRKSALASWRHLGRGMTDELVTTQSYTEQEVKWCAFYFQKRRISLYSRS